MLAFVPTSPVLTRTLVPLPSSVMSFTSNVEPVFFGGRNVWMAYDLLKVRPATDVEATFHVDWPNNRPKPRAKLGLRTVTWTDRSGSHATQVGDGVLIEARR